MDVFDIIGPVMIGPSSSHTAGAVRIGNVAANVLGEEPAKISVLFTGSLAKTYRGHGSDCATVAGVLRMAPDDRLIPESLSIAAQKQIVLKFTTGKIEGSHPNTMRIRLQGRTGKNVNVVGSSIGGGNIFISSINGKDVGFDGKYNTLIVTHHDRPGVIASVTTLLAENGINIAGMRDSRINPNGSADMQIETDQKVGEQLLGLLRELPFIHQILQIEAVCSSGRRLMGVQL